MVYHGVRDFTIPFTAFGIIFMPQFCDTICAVLNNKLCARLKLFYLFDASDEAI